MTLEEFTPIVGKLAKQLNKELDADTIVVYYDVMKEFSEEITYAAAAQLARTSKWFPKTSEWRECALLIEQNKRRAELSGPRSWKLECEVCEDTGWIFFWCLGLEVPASDLGRRDETMPVEQCDRDRSHLPHSFVRVCPCRETNRTYQRHHMPAVKAS